MSRLGTSDGFIDRGRRASVADEGPRYPLLYFVIAGLVSIAVVAGGGALASRRVGTTMAVGEVQHLGETLGQSFAEPNMSEALLAGDPAALAEFDQLVRNRILSEDVVRVKIWDADGRIVYSDEPRLIGQQAGLQSHEMAVLGSDMGMATVADLADPSNLYDDGFGRLLEVYVPIDGPDGNPLLFEMYVRYDAVSAHGAQMWNAFLPIVLGTVLVLGLIQLPLAWRMTRRLERNRYQREQLLRKAIEAANVEDRRIACDLHDGVVQDLTANSFTLAAAGEMIAAGDQTRARELVSRSAESVRGSIAALRAFIVDLYPPNLQEEGLHAAIGDLLRSAATEGLDTSLEMPGGQKLSPEEEALAYRTVRESIRNVVKHAGAQHVTVTLSDTTDSIVIEITDDGIGFQPEAVATNGHIGLRLLKDLTSEMDAKLVVNSVPGDGTTVRLEMPV